jgi:NitT/TauT family transport system substrate-binding protein
VRDEENDAKGLYRVLADVGGTELVGPARDMDSGTFYDPGKAD